jgi:hypothetical protein
MANSATRMGRTAMVLAVMLAGCQPAPAPTAAVPVVSFDGHYSGTRLLTGVASGADRSWCQVPPQFAVDVVNNAFSYSYGLPNLPKAAPATFSATIAQDGTFQGSGNNTGVISGQIAGATMTGMIDGIGCAYQFNATRL